MEFLDKIENDPEALTTLTHGDYARPGGMESAEVIMWRVMRGALSEWVRKVHQMYYLPSMTALATAIYEDLDGVSDDAESAEQRARIAGPLAGAEELPGTYPFTLETSVRAYRLNRFLHQLADPGQRRRFLAEPETLFREHGLTTDECDMVRRRDWRAMIQHGVIFFVLEKLGAVTGVSNLHIYAAMRGETLDEFLKTRNAPGALYSAGAARGQSWEK